MFHLVFYHVPQCFTMLRPYPPCPACSHHVSPCSIIFLLIFLHFLTYFPSCSHHVHHGLIMFSQCSIKFSPFISHFLPMFSPCSIMFHHVLSCSDHVHYLLAFSHHVLTMFHHVLTIWVSSGFSDFLLPSKNMSDDWINYNI